MTKIEALSKIADRLLGIIEMDPREPGNPSDSQIKFAQEELSRVTESIFSLQEEKP